MTSKNTDHLIEKKVDSTSIYKGSRISMRRDTVELPDGRKAHRDIVDHPGAVCVIPVLKNNRICLVQQYRYALEKVTLEVPAGCIDPGEDPLVAAKRELQEETGYTAQNWTKLTAVYLAPGFCNEYMHIYMASDLTMTEQNLDPDEYVDLIECSFQDFEKWVMDGAIIDGKTCVAYGLVKHLLDV